MNHFAIPSQIRLALTKSFALSLCLALVSLEAAPAFARNEDRYAYTPSRAQDFQNGYKPPKNFSLTSQLDRQIQIQNTALQFRFGQRIEIKSPTFTLSPNNAPTLPQPKFQFGTASPKPLVSFKTEIPKPLAVSRMEPKGLLGAVVNALKPVVNAIKATFQAIGQSITKAVQFFAVDKAKITYQVQRDMVLKENPNIREVSRGAFQVPPSQTAQQGGRTWESGTTFQLNSNGRISLTEGVTLSPDLGGISRADGKLLPVKMIGENGIVKPVGIDFARVEPKTNFNLTHPVTMDGVGKIPAGASMTFEGTKPGSESQTPTVVLSFQNARLENHAFQSLGNGKEPLTLAQAEMKLKGAIYQINNLYMNRGKEKFYGSEKGELFSLTQLEGKNSAVQSKSADLTKQSKKLSDDTQGAVNLSNHHMESLHKVTGTPATVNFQTKEPVKTQAETAKTLQVQANVLAQHMDQGNYGAVANAVTDIEATQNALTDQIKTQQTQVETFQAYKRAVKGLEQAYGAMAAQADPASMKGSEITKEQINDAAPYFQEQKNDIRIQSTNAVKALNEMAKQGIITPAEQILKVVEVKAIRDHLLVARPDNVGNAVKKTASALEQNYQGVSKDFDEAIFDHLDKASEKYPKTMGAVGHGVLAVAGVAAVVGVGFGLATQPATTVVVVGAGVISQKAFEAMGLTPEAASFYSVLLTAPVVVGATASNSMKSIDSSIVGTVRGFLTGVVEFFRNGNGSIAETVNSEAGHVYMGPPVAGEAGSVSKTVTAVETQTLKQKPWRNEDPFQFFMREVDNLDLSSPPNKAIFYSGEGSRTSAFSYKTATNKWSIEDTNGGKWLEKFDLFGRGGNSPVTREQAELIWNRASQKYAAGASGEITLFVHKSEGTRTFYQHEFPALQQNKNIHRWSYKD
ncbi:MAG: hypothetical protein IPP35_05375 [Elusimicrobia bacterium]|nr:hypothetical protein [Elusimicrobiota bacterium]